MANDLPPIPHEGFGGWYRWLAQNIAGQEPDHELLTRGLAQGRIRDARVRNDGSIAVVFWDQRDKQERSERLFDPPGFFVIRGLCLPKTHIRYDHNVLNKEKPEKERHYIQLFGDISALRILGDASANQQVRQLGGGHYDLRRANLYLTAALPGEKTKRTHQDRDDTKSLALNNYDKLGQGWLRKVLQQEDYSWLLKQGFTLLDNLPLGRALKEAAE